MKKQQTAKPTGTMVEPFSSLHNSLEAQNPLDTPYRTLLEPSQREDSVHSLQIELGLVLEIVFGILRL